MPIHRRSIEPFEPIGRIAFCSLCEINIYSESGLSQFSNESKGDLGWCFFDIFGSGFNEP